MRARSRGIIRSICCNLVDVTGLVIYFNVALFILRGTLL